LKRKSTCLTILSCLLIYPLLFLLLGLASLVIILPRVTDEAGESPPISTHRLVDMGGEPTARSTYRLAVLPGASPTTSPTSNPTSSAAGPEAASAAAIEAAAVMDSASLPSAGSSDPAGSSPSSAAPAPGSASPPAPVQPLASPTDTPAQAAANTTQATGAVAAVQPSPVAAAPPTAAPTATVAQSSGSINAAKAPPVATPKPTQPPRARPTPTLTPVPDYDFMLAEFFNSPTTNAFLLIYVAVVDPKEIPIGDMKVVGTRLDENLTYESPLTKWHYDGSSAPGEVIKTGNTKFEPPQAMETTSWVLHLADAHGNRQSADVPFDVDENNKQWYFIKFRRKF
jgi:hypothetical protein